MSLGLQLILSTALATAAPGCSWAHPGANPYRGEPARALADFNLPAGTRRKLQAMMAAHRYSDVAVITRDDIVGEHGYGDLREMHSGGGQVCHGAVDRSAWSATRRERGLVYCADDACVIVPTICNNVSLVTRRPEREAVLDESPIDISPAAGPTPPPADTATAAMAPGEFIGLPGAGETVPALPESPGSGTQGGGGSPGGGGFPGGDLPGGPPIGGGTPCCDTGPTLPGGPGTPGGPGAPGGPPVVVPPIDTPPVDTPPLAVPEAPAWAMLLGGIALMGALARRRQDRRT